MPETIVSAASSLRRGETTAAALVQQSLDAVTRHNRRTNAFITVRADEARRAAHLADAELARGLDRGRLHGIPISLKDLIDEAGIVTTAASHVLDDRIPERSATLVERLRDAGAIVIGRTNLHQFAFGTTSEESAYGAVRNPADVERSAGGSSGGSAAAVATGMGLASVGTDTGGSIRIPAAACGVVGLKPSQGDIPTEGVIPLSRTLDHAGPIARCVQDAAWLWSVMARRPCESPRPGETATVRLAHLGGYFDVLAAEVRAAFEAAVRRLTAQGVHVRDAHVAEADRINQTYFDIQLPEAAAAHDAWLESHASGYLPAIRERLLQGRATSAVAYLKARNDAARLRKHVDAALEGVDALVLPTLPIVAPPLGTMTAGLPQPDDEPMPLRQAMLRHTRLFNLSGHPAITLPIPTQGLPVGMQLVGRIGQTERLLSVAAACEAALGSPQVQ